MYRTLDNSTPTQAITTPRSPDEYAQRSRSDNTKRGYASDLKGFASWCVHRNVSSFPATPSTIATYITERANEGKKVATIRRCLSAIAMIHKRAGLPNPCETGEVTAVMEGITRTKGLAPNQKKPLTIEVLREILRFVPQDHKGLRDRAILLLQFAGALRRSELVALQMKNLEFTPEGLRLTLTKSKTDQEGRGDVLGIVHGQHPETCVIKSLKQWIEAARLVDGSLFRAVSCHGHISPKALSSGSVARVVKNYVEAAGLDPTLYSGHSARAGFITSAALAGASERQISRVSRHRSVESLRQYVRTATVFEDSATGMVGL